METENALGRAQGRSVADPKQRKALEDYGVLRAMAYFRKKGYAVEDLGGRSSYDVCCRKNRQTLCVEVKTTTTSGEQVILTPRDAKLKGTRALFVVHSVELVKGKPKAGSRRSFCRSRFNPEHLKPIAYMYTVPET